MTSKLAVFVEGLTEQIFVKNLVMEICGDRSIALHEAQYRNDNICTLRGSSTVDETKKYFVLIVDCESDKRVKSVILDNRENLEKGNYFGIIGLRDLYPHDRSDLEKLERGLRTRVPTKGIPIDFVVSVMEIEAWFLQESTHYGKIHDDLTVENIYRQTGFHANNDNAEDVPHPAELLDDIYKIVGMRYIKRNRKIKAKIERTVESLDYENLYFNIRNRIPSLNKLIALMDGYA